MAKITIETHDFLGKLTIIKNALALLKKDCQKPQEQDYIKKDLDSTQNLIYWLKNQNG